MQNKAVIIGLDGATFDVIDPLIEEGFLPNIKMLKDNGAYGKMESTIPPVTAPAWVSMATGKNPGKTGVFDFLNLKDKSSYIAVSSNVFAGSAYWDYLNKAGYKIGILNYPVLYPPYQIEGFMVSGLGAFVKDEFCYPSALKDELDRITNGYEIMLSPNKAKYVEHEKRFVKDMEIFIEKRIKAVRYLMENKVWDLFIVVFSAPDILQHYLWKFWDTDTSEIETGKKKTLRKAFCNLWNQVDQGIGEILKIIPAKTNVFIVSDHGAGPQKGIFYPNTWLKEKGYLKLKTGNNKTFSFKNSTKTFAKGVLGWVDNKFGSDLRFYFSKFTTKDTNFTAGFDLDNSVAYAAKHSTISVAGIRIVPQGNKKAIIREKIIEDLKQLSNEEGLKIDIWKSEEIYKGSYVDTFPDLIFSINNFEYAIREKVIGEDIHIRDQQARKTISGCHRLNGIFIASGPEIRHINIEAKIYDVAPTVLHIMGEQIPDDMDGKVLEEIFELDSHVLSRKIEFRAPFAGSSLGNEDQERNKMIEQQLIDLGYM